MVMSYFNSKTRQKNKDKPTSPTSPEPVQSPILNEEEEQFLARITSENQEPEGTPPPLPERPVAILNNGEVKTGKDAQTALMDGADSVPLPTSPPVESEGNEILDGEKVKGKGKEKEKDAEGKDKRSSFISYFSTVPGRLKSVREKGKAKEKEKASEKGKEKAAKDIQDAAESAKSSQEEEVKKEEQDLTAILDQLNLSAVNNRVFSFSKESQELLEKFKLVLKDIVNGAPTAYNDLEKLLTDSEGQLKKMYGSLPPFLQNLVKSLPTKMSAALAPELMAAASEKPGFDAKMAQASTSGTKKKSKRSRMVPPLKSLVSEKGAVAAMLRSILSFLKLRFPAFVTGTNVLMSLAIFILLFVFWYCHKRGRETRLEKERLAAESADLSADSSGISDLEDSLLVDEKTAGSSAKDNGSAEPPIVIHDAGDKPSATVDDMPSVLHLPEPSSVPLPTSEGPTPAKEKEEPLKAK